MKRRAFDQTNARGRKVASHRDVQTFFEHRAETHHSQCAHVSDKGLPSVERSVHILRPRRRDLGDNAEVFHPVHVAVPHELQMRDCMARGSIGTLSFDLFQGVDCFSCRSVADRMYHHRYVGLIDSAHHRQHLVLGEDYAAVVGSVAGKIRFVECSRRGLDRSIV